MMERILLVDDESNILEGHRRKFRKQFDLHLAQSPLEGLKTLTKEGPFAVIVSDFNMPGMNGVEFLTEARVLAPDTVRIMLTGFADISIAINAVNDGAVFRFLTKPCSQEDLAKAINAGVEQNRLIRAEKELLENTLTGSIRALIDVLALTNPQGMGKASRLRKYVSGIVEELEITESWKYEVAALLSPLDHLAAPTFSPSQSQRESISLTHEKSSSSIPMGAQIMKNIPRLEDIVETLMYKNVRFDGSNSPDPHRKGEDIPVGARLLKAAHDFDTLREKGMTMAQAFQNMQDHASHYDPKVLAALETVFVPQVTPSIVSIPITDLKPRMCLAKTLTDKQGRILLEAGHELTEWVITWMDVQSIVGEIDDTVEVVISESLITKGQNVEQTLAQLATISA